MNDQAQYNILSRRQDAYESRLQELSVKLDENTRATQAVEKNTSEMLTVFQSWKGAFKVIEFLGKVFTPISAIIGTVVGVVVWLKTK